MKFSQRIGKIDVSNVLQTESISEDLKNRLWSVFTEVVINGDFTYSRYGSVSDYSKFATNLWFNFFKAPTDTVPDYEAGITKVIRDFFFRAQWYEIYDFLEFTVQYRKKPSFIKLLNKVLEEELAGYRIIDSIFVPVTNDIDIQSIQDAISESNFSGVRKHIKNGLIHLAKKKKPDTRAVIKEAISAVECAARTIAPDANTLGKALNLIHKAGKISNFQKQSFEKMYAYTNGPNGIRHALMEESDISVDEAKYFLISCSAFSSFLQTLA